MLCAWTNRFRAFTESRYALRMDANHLRGDGRRNFENKKEIKKVSAQRNARTHFRVFCITTRRATVRS